MLQLSALAIALHGIGFGTMLTALQGLLAVTSFEPPVIGGARIPVRRRVRRVLIDWAEDERQQQVDDDEALELAGVFDSRRLPANSGDRKSSQFS